MEICPRSVRVQAGRVRTSYWMLRAPYEVRIGTSGTKRYISGLIDTIDVFLKLCHQWSNDESFHAVELFKKAGLRKHLVENQSNYMLAGVRRKYASNYIDNMACLTPQFVLVLCNLQEESSKENSIVALNWVNVLILWDETKRWRGFVSPLLKEEKDSFFSHTHRS